ncbi:Ribosomal large subunit pseudouridine synthase D [uncultured Eubacterium sp.]|nr:Ribosomal large subunit pseudouridine synthase D [uncultured Eubacterium sp.]
MAKFEYIVTKEDEGVPVKGLLRTKFKFSSRLLTKLKYQHLVFLNGEEVAGWITPEIGDVLSIKLPEEKSDFPVEDIPIYPVFEDDDLLVLNKQPGVIVHPTKGHPSHTIANGLMKYMEDTAQMFKIRFVNRLDMDTTGLLIVAKNSHSQDNLTKQMKANAVEKRYIAVANGIIDKDAFTIDLPIGRPDPENVARGVMQEGGFPSITHVKVLERFPKGKGYTMVELLLETGRTHQIRVHMSHIGHPLVGDYLYGGENPWLIERQALHAFKLSFNHPLTGERLEIEAPLPADIQEVIKKIKS